MIFFIYYSPYDRGSAAAIPKMTFNTVFTMCAHSCMYIIFITIIAVHTHTYIFIYTNYMFMCVLTLFMYFPAGRTVLQCIVHDRKISAAAKKKQ